LRALCGWDAQGAGAALAPGLRERHTGIPQVAHHIIPWRFRSLSDPFDQVVERFRLLFHAEAAVAGDPVDALDEQGLPTSDGDGAGPAGHIANPPANAVGNS
jgi:hypothetical protein